MKLRNKDDGRVREFGIEEGKSFPYYLRDEYGNTAHFKTLAEVARYWEDYEEDELLYVISAEHKSGYQCVLKEDYPEICKVAKELGIGFETEKECQKAVLKLKAWKRLKDKGFELSGCFDTDEGEDGEVLVMTNGYIPHIDDDILANLEIVFGGEE